MDLSVNKSGMLRIIVVFIALLVTCALGATQEYTPKQGEVVLKVAIEGRGNIFIRLYTQRAPTITSHIMRLAKQGFYDGQRFHRVIRSPKPYLIQVGDPESKTRNVDDISGTQGSGARIQYEDTRLPNKARAVGLALDATTRTGDSQFYILLSDQSILDGKYPVFGEVIEGWDVVQRVNKGDRILSATILGG